MISTAIRSWPTALCALPIVVAGLWAGALPAAAAPTAGRAAAAAAPTCDRVGASDVDGDGVTDPVVGDPHGSPSGGIVVYGSRAPYDHPRFLAGSAFAGLNASPGFGTAIARVDVNHDACDDLLVSDPGHAGGGAVDVLWGSPYGIRTTGATQILEQHGHDDGFGTALGAAVNLCYPQPCSDTIDLWVGVPNRAVGGVPGAGTIDHYLLRANGTAKYKNTATANDAAPLTQATAGGRFGAVLAANNTYAGDVMLVGLPEATVNGRPGAGAIVDLSFYLGRFHPEFTLSQNSPGVAGGAEAGDHFGAAISVGADGELAVGVPDEDLGATADAGLVDLFDLSEGFPAFTGSTTQDSPGVPGVAEAGDHFGASVALGIPTTESDCFPYVGRYRVLAIGVPGEDNSGHRDSGTVAVLIERRLNQGDRCTPFRLTSAMALTQGRGTLLGGANEAQDHVGATVDVSYNPFLRDSDSVVVLGVPGEDIGSTLDAGTAYAFNTATRAVRVIGNLGGRQSGLRFGSVLATEVGQ